MTWWKSVTRYLLATIYKVKFTVQFVWKNNERATHPSRYGYLQT